MMSGAFLWDTCVIYRFLGNPDADYLDHIQKFLSECDAGQIEIFISTISLAEIRPSSMGRSGLTPSQVLASVSKSFKMVDTSPDIMSLAGYLRDQTYRHVELTDAKAPPRILGLGDSIHLATAVALREEFGVQNLTLHTFDEGKRRDGESGKKTVPIDGFQNWCRGIEGDEEIQKVLSTPRSKPVHPSCQLPKSKVK
jgi:predicted nucleic acid-binding protein